MITCQLRTLLPSNFLFTFTVRTLTEALKVMWKYERERKEEIALYGFNGKEFLKLTDTQIYKSRGVYETKNYSVCFLEGVKS